LSHSYLDMINDYRDLYRLKLEEKNRLCGEIRQMIIGVATENGGHLASSLGAVELVVALLSVFDPMKDKIVFDVGHQAYAYKILTGRKDRFHTLRQWGGISGFPKREESPYDHFDTGHAGTSISAAMGYAKARDLLHQSHNVIAVVGDASISNGMSLEALNQIEELKTKVIIVLNDNKMSINFPIGGLAKHLSHLSTNPSYRKMKDALRSACKNLPLGGSLIEESLKKLKYQIKTALQPINMFEALGINYWGPFNGHNLEELEEVFKLAKAFDESVLIHVITKKGKGYAPAEENPTKYHGVSPRRPRQDAEIVSWSKACAECVERIAEKDKRVVCLTAAMEEGCGLSRFKKRFPDRFFDVGIAEEHMLTYAAGLAAGGMRPVAFIYSTFLQRAGDQLYHDIAMQKLPVVISLDRSGLVGEDGETHQGLLDIPWFKSVPGLIIASPRDVADMEFMFSNLIKNCDMPAIVRYPKGDAPKRLARDVDAPCAPWLKAEVLRHGREVLLIGHGGVISMLIESCNKIADIYNIDPTLVDLRFLKPLDLETLNKLFVDHSLVIMAEESYAIGGIGEQLLGFAQRVNKHIRWEHMAVPDLYVPHGAKDEQLRYVGICCDEVVKKVSEYLETAPR